MRESKKLRLLCLAALFAGAIAVTTAYLLHIPIPTGGYIHLGDALIYLAACLLPAPYAVGAAMVGAGAGGSAHRAPVGGPHAAHQGPGGPPVYQPGTAAPLPPERGGPSAGLPALPGGVRPGRLPAAGRRQRLLAPVPGHAGTGGGQRGGLYCLGAGPGRAGGKARLAPHSQGLTFPPVWSPRVENFPLPMPLSGAILFSHEEGLL